MQIQTIFSLFSLVISIVALVVSLIIYRENRKLTVKPVLVFLRRSSDKWVLSNVGNGPALNILLGKKGWESKRWESFTHCYPIPANDEVELNWLSGAALAVVYQDVDRREYTTKIQYDRNTIEDGNSFKSMWPKLNEESVRNEFDRRREG